MNCCLKEKTMFKMTGIIKFYVFDMLPIKFMFGHIPD